MPVSPTTPGRPGTRAYAPVRIAFHLRNSVGTRDMNLYEAQWLVPPSVTKQSVTFLVCEYGEFLATLPYGGAC
jgi:hypothetical protein